MGEDALAAMEDIDHARGDPQVDLGADQCVRDRIRKVMYLDVIVGADPRAAIPRTPNRRWASLMRA